jgi:hypothetical protein
MRFREILQHSFFSKPILILIGIFSVIQLLIIYYIPEELLSMRQLNVLLNIISWVFIILIIQYCNHHSLIKSLRTTLFTLRKTDLEFILWLVIGLLNYQVYTYYSNIFLILWTKHIFWIGNVIAYFLVIYATYMKVKSLQTLNNMQTNNWVFRKNFRRLDIIRFSIVFYVIQNAIRFWNNNLINSANYEPDEHFLLLNALIMIGVSYIWFWIIINYVHYLVYKSDLTFNEK